MLGIWDNGKYNLFEGKYEGREFSKSALAAEPFYQNLEQIGELVSVYFNEAQDHLGVRLEGVEANKLQKVTRTT